MDLIPCTACPQHLPIRELLERTAEVFEHK